MKVPFHFFYSWIMKGYLEKLCNCWCHGQWQGCWVLLWPQAWGTPADFGARERDCIALMGTAKALSYRGLAQRCSASSGWASGSSCEWGLRFYMAAWCSPGFPSSCSKGEGNLATSLICRWYTVNSFKARQEILLKEPEAEDGDLHMIWLKQKIFF